MEEEGPPRRPPPPPPLLLLLSSPPELAPKRPLIEWIKSSGATISIGTDPEEAVKIFIALQTERAFACHWATFRMTDEPYREPAEKLAAALEAAGIDPARFIADPPGRVLELE